MTLSIFDLLLIITGAFAWWVGVYLFSNNPRSILSWKALVFLLSLSSILISEPIIIHARNFEEYLIWQKITDWPFFLMPIFCYHSSLLVGNYKEVIKKRKIGFYILVLGYVGAILFYILDLYGGLIMKEELLVVSRYLRFNNLKPGILLLPSVFVAIFYFVLSIINFTKKIKIEFAKYFLPVLGSFILAIAALIVGVANIISMPTIEVLIIILISVGTLLFIYSILRCQLFIENEKIIFDQKFLYRTFFIIAIIGLYLIGYTISGTSLTFSSLVLSIITIILVLTTHSLYDWLTTFINDFIYNSASGLSVVSDKEALQAIKHLNSPSKLENNSLQRLSLVSKVFRKKKLTPLDGLRDVVEDAIEYFKPKKDPHRRTKQNLKYYLLKMIAYDQAEEGQILWELGFEDYPLRIMTNESGHRPPLFKASAPSDYTYTSRNAYLALKKEAIHNVAWRISYLEKQRKG